jgi:hypothetical protein
MSVTFTNINNTNLNNSLIDSNKSYTINNKYVKGNVNQHIYTILTSITDLKIENSILLGGGGSSQQAQNNSPGDPGRHAILINTGYTISNLINYGGLVGGGGGSGKSMMYNNNTNTSGIPGGAGAGSGNVNNGVGFSQIIKNDICIGGNGAGRDSNGNTINYSAALGIGGNGGNYYSYAGGGCGGGAGGGSGGPGGSSYGYGGGGGGCGGGEGGNGGAAGNSYSAGGKGGNGGYGIQNDGIITNLINSQCHFSCGYGPLFYNGNAPSNYKIIIDSSSSYGQLYYKGNFSNVNISIGKTNSGTISLRTYSAVLFHVTGLVDPLPSGTNSGYSWNLVKNNNYKYTDNTIIPVYDLVVTEIFAPPSGYIVNDNNIYINTDLSDIFKVYLSGTKVSNTGYKTSDGSDLSTLYQKYSSGSQPTTGYQTSDGTDLGILFQST